MPTLQACYGFEEGKHYFRKLYGQEFLNKKGGFIGNDFYKNNWLISDINANTFDSGFLYQSRIDARIKHAVARL
jgi:hypothetical protein